MVCCAAVIAILPSVVEACTLNSHCARSWPFVVAVSMSAVIELRSLRFTRVTVDGHGGGPESIQMLCQCDANTRPPISVNSLSASRDVVGFVLGFWPPSHDKNAMS